MLLKEYIEKRLSEADLISPDRKSLLQAWAKDMAYEYKLNQKLDLLFICTHNSRRSQFAEAWGTSAAAYFDLKNTKCYSGGTEVTACHQNTVNALESAGFTHRPAGRENNKTYPLSSTDPAIEMLLYSKLYNTEENPQKQFFALMTCASADQNCPYIPEALSRIALNYEDPKVADDTPQESEVYAERCSEIAREILFAFATLKSLLN